MSTRLLHCKVLDTARCSKKWSWRLARWHLHSTWQPGATVGKLGSNLKGDRDRIADLFRNVAFEMGKHLLSTIG